MREDRRVLIVAFDGLRPDMATAERMPNLDSVRSVGVDFADCRAVFPTETRVNQASLVTGRHPSGHGIVANKFVDPTLGGGFINTSNFEASRRADDALDGKLLHGESLGEVLGRSDGSLAVVGCGTAGGNRMLHHTAARRGEINVSAHGPEHTTTPDALAWLASRIGPPPAAAIPNEGRIEWVARAYREAVAPERDPTVTILWFSDPDVPYHYRGLASAEADAGIRAADRALGALLDWRRESGRDDSLQIIAMSDHGHVTAVGPALDVAARLAAAGFELAESPGGDGDAVLVPGSCGSLYCRDVEAQAALVDWLWAQPWIELIFARAMKGAEAAPEGTLALAAAHIDNARAGDIVFTTLRDEAAGPAGLVGRCLHDNADIADGGGLHGGLSRTEARAVLAADGTGFASGRRIAAPVGLIDVMAMVLSLLEIEAPPAMDGRVPAGALADDGAREEAAARAEATTAQRGARRQTVKTTRVGEARYIDEGRLEGAPGIDDVVV